MERSGISLGWPCNSTQKPITLPFNTKAAWKSVYIISNPTPKFALGIGLVDEIGTLEDAIKYAADLAGDENLASWNIKGYPAPQTTMEMIMSSINGPKEDYAVRLAKQFCKTGVYARLPIEMKLAY